MSRRFMVAAVAGIAALVGCGESSSPSGTNAGNQGGKANRSRGSAVTHADIAGNWVIEPAAYEAYASSFSRRLLAGSGVPATDALIAEGAAEVAAEIAAHPPTFVVNADGSFDLRVGAEEGNAGTWTLSGDTVTFANTAVMDPGSFTYRNGRLVSVRQVEGEAEFALIKQ